MSATLTPRRVTKVGKIDMEQLRDGLGNATTLAPGELETAGDEWDYDIGDHPALLAWDDLVNEAIAEVAPAVRRLLVAAIEKRLPWTWEGGEDA